MLRARLILGLLLLSLCSTVYAAYSEDDIDGDGLLNTQEDVNDNGVVDPGETSPFNADSDNGGESDGTETEGGRNPLDPSDDLTSDEDGDGLVISAEIALGTDPNNPDTDGDGTQDGGDAFPVDRRYHKDTDDDGIADGWEEVYGLDPNDPNDARVDGDRDRLTNLQEFVLNTNPNDQDTDADGVIDVQDPFPNDPLYTDDSDDDGLPDSWEQARRFNPSQPGEEDEDPDGDNLTNEEEFANDTGPHKADTDDAGTPDDEEVAAGTAANKLECLAYERAKTPFVDVGNHWGEDMIGILQGTSILPDYTPIFRGYKTSENATGSQFLPDRSITRFEFLKIALLSTCTPLLSEDDVRDFPFEFVDVLRRGDVERATIIYSGVHHSIIQGYDDDTFRPDQNISRAEAVKIMLRLVSLDDPKHGSQAQDFPDVPQNAWFSAYIKQASLHGIVQGYEDGTFKPQNPITRAEAAKLMYALIKRNVRVNGEVIP